MNKIILIFTLLFSFGLFAAGEPAWPASFDANVAARETARTAAKSSATTANVAALDFASVTAEDLLSCGFFGTYQWYLSNVTDFALDSDKRMRALILIR